MSLYVDSAYLEDVARLCATFPIFGVTTNPPVLLAATSRGQLLDDVSVLRELLRLCEGPVFMQPGGSTAEDLYAGASRYLTVAPNRVVPKLPMSPEGLQAGMRLKREGMRVAYTAVYTLAPSYAAAMAGASWVIHYCGRMCRAGMDACERISRMARLLAQHAEGTRILVASIKSGMDLVESALAGAQDVTTGPEVIEGMLADPLTESALRQFGADWERLQLLLQAQ
ncbi:MAG: fructose-6-phosphate aldolase [Ktedonobacterales bacterium]